MLLTSLELQGFKTFPEKTVLHFEKGITAVVGPNGSGKSNISDAIRWVLGEQSVKTLRCSKMEDVIFGGTPGRRALGYAQVTLYIENKDRALAYDDDTVSITRRYYRSGESEYLINGANVRLRDINELFMDTGLGRDGYSIIGQGKIDSIVSAHSQERREIFEEAAGISRFRYRKEESERRLQKAEENMLRLQDIASELEARAEPLKEQSEKAEEFLRLSEEKRSLEIGVWLTTLNRSGKVLREQTDQIASSQLSYDQVQKEAEELAASQEACYRRMNEYTSNAEQDRQEASQKEEEATRTQADIYVWKNDISHHESDIRRLTNDLSKAQEQREDLENEIIRQKELAAEKTQQLEEQNKKQSETFSKLEELRRHMDETAAQNLSLTEKISRLRVACEEQRTRLASADSALGEIENHRGSMEETLRQREAELEAKQAEKQDHQRMIADIQQSMQALENAGNGYAMRVASRKEKAEAAKKQAEQILLDRQAMERRIRMLEDMEKNLEGFQQSVKMVLREAARGTLSGIKGTVSQLLHVQKVYAAALETALGPALQNIVTENEQHAKQAIYFLKQKNAGRATFLPLTTIRGHVLHEPSLEQCPGFVGIGSELCRCEAEYEGILRSLLGRVVVAEDLDAATAIARRFQYKFRVVTLDGQVINAGGSMTGGSMIRHAGLLSRRSDIEQAESQAKVLAEKADQAMAHVEELQQALQKAEADLQTARSEYVTAREELLLVEAEQKRCEAESDSIQKQIEELKNEQLSGLSRMETLQQSKREAEDNLAKLTDQMEKVQQEQQALSQSRDDWSLQGDELSQQLQNYRMAVFALEKERDACRDEIRRHQELLTHQAEQRQKLKEEKEQFESATVSLHSKITQAQAKIERLQQEAQDCRNKADTHMKKRAEVEQEAAQLRQKERDANDRKQKISEDLTKLIERKENLQKQYDEIIQKLWDEYELTRREAEQMDITIEDPATAQKQLTLLRGKIRALGTVNVAAIDEYKEVSERYRFLSEQMDDVRRSREELLQLIHELTGKMKEIFTEQFAKIGRHFSEIYQTLFGGGSAELLLSDEQDVLSSGIEITAQPPGKIVTHIESLSGGEKALTAICLYFAIMKVNPPPFCMLDEIEAALDDVNVDRFAAYLRRMAAGGTQFIAITHRRGTMEEADVLYGVTMQDEGISRLLQLKNQDDAGAYIANR